VLHLVSYLITDETDRYDSIVSNVEIRCNTLFLVSFKVGNTTERFTNLLYLQTPMLRRPPLWSSGQSSWLQIQRSTQPREDN
jgi:hypothetical protein